MLVAALVHALQEVALAVEEPHADHGQREVRRLLEDVACQDTEAACVDGKGDVDGEFGAEKRNRARARGATGEGRPCRIRLDGRENALRALDEPGVTGRAVQRCG